MRPARDKAPLALRLSRAHARRFVLLRLRARSGRAHRRA